MHMLRTEKSGMQLCGYIDSSFKKRKTQNLQTNCKYSIVEFHTDLLILWTLTLDWDF